MIQVLTNDGKSSTDEGLLLVIDSSGKVKKIIDGTVTLIQTSYPLTGGPITSTGTIGINQATSSSDGYLSSTDWTKFNNKQDALSGSGVVKSTSGTISYISGLASQYIRGDGALADFPNNTGGGSVVNYYLNGSISQGNIDGNLYHQMSKTPIIGGGSNFDISTNGYIGYFITDVLDPSLLSIPAGSWNFKIYMSANSNGGSPSFYLELYKYNGSAFTLIADSSGNPEMITGGTSLDLYYTSVAVPQTALTTSDRLAVRIYVNNSGKTITLHTENDTLAQVSTTFSTGLTALNGLIAQVQYFGNDTNITMVSATNTHTLTWAGTLADSRITSAGNWNTAYTNRITNLTTIGTSGAATLIANVLNIPQYSSSTTASVTADLTVGAINAGDILASGTTLQQFIEALLVKIYNPTITAPSFYVTTDQSSPEIGSVISVTVLFAFNRGSILGSTSGTWNPSYFQNYRAGASTSYTIAGNVQSTNSRTITGYTVVATNTFTGTVTYATGPQPLNSKGGNYSTPLAGATSPTQSTTFTGIYPYYWYKSSSPITASSMQSAIASGAATKVLGDSTGTITINFAATGQYLAFAYPATSTTKTVWYVNALDNGTIPGGVFGGQTTLACSSSSSYWSNVNYKIHVTAGLITQSNPMELRNS